jgi:hypothetical protein
MSEPLTLAEGRWFWRRLFVFGLTWHLWRLLAGVHPKLQPADVPEYARGLMGLLALVLVLYLVAPTAQQLVALLAETRLRLGGGGR